MTLAGSGMAGMMFSGLGVADTGGWQDSSSTIPTGSGEPAKRSAKSMYCSSDQCGVLRGIDCDMYFSKP